MVSVAFPESLGTARVYIRTSRADEKEIHDNQREKALDYASRRFQDAFLYEEVVSGGDEERRGLGALLRDLKPGETVVFTAPSRMTRGGLGAAMHILYQIEQKGAGWHFTEYPVLNFGDTTAPMVKAVIMAFLTEYDADYRRRISERTRAKLAQLKAGGKKLGGSRPGAGRPRKNQRSPPKALEPERVVFNAPLKSESGTPSGGGGRRKSGPLETVPAAGGEPAG